MIINGASLFSMQPIKDMLDSKQVSPAGVSHGLGEAGYDIRLKQDITFNPPKWFGLGKPSIKRVDDNRVSSIFRSRFVLASAIEEFQMPTNLVAKVCDKSTWARQGVSVFNTVIEPGWKGFLTLEIVFHWNKPVHIPAGSGIAQVVFYQTTDHAAYSGKYQNQKDEPVASIWQK